MTLDEAKEIAGHMVDWQQNNYVMVHSIYPEMNTPAQNLIMEACNMLLQPPKQPRS